MNKVEVLRLISETAKQLEGATPERIAEVTAQLAKILPSAFVSDALKDKLAVDCKTFDPDGYKAFYELVHGFPPPLHVMVEVQSIFDAHDDGMGSIIFASRGFWKTVSISVTFTAWMIGTHPRLTHMIVGANDDSAEKVTKAIAAIIQYHPEWVRAFPNVVPDMGKWSVEGFSVIDTSVSREEWARFQSGTVDPTLVGGGWESSRLNGKHPTGLLILDDVHERKNTSSDRELKAVIDTVTKTILKTAMRSKDKLTTFMINIATPWVLEDVNHVMKATGEYKFVNIPAAVRSVQGQGIYCDGLGRDGAVYEDIVGWWTLTWPEGYGINSFKADRATLGKAAFWQMIMLDLATASTGRLKYVGYPFDQIDLNWITLGGADPTTFTEAAEGNRNSHFALYCVAKTPQGKAVVVDGYLEQCTQLEAENQIIKAQNKFPNWQSTYVEDVSVGKMFLQTIQKNHAIKAMPSGLKGLTDAKINSKRDRILVDMAKWFENGTVSISTEDTPALNALRRLFDKFYDLDPKHDKSFDAGDAVFHALKNMPDILFVSDVNPFVKEEKKSEYPLNGFAQHQGYGATWN